MRGRINWSGLPPELLERIVEKFNEIADRVRFGAVCKPWQSASKSETRRPVLPWLLLPSPNPPDIHNFFSLFENKIYTLPLPDTHHKAIYESSRGYLLTQDHFGMENTIHLLNPITRTQTSLPPLPPLENYAVERWKLVVKSGSNVIMLSVAYGPIFICEKEEGADWGDWRDWREMEWVPICTQLEFTFHQESYFVFDGRTGKISIVDPNSLEEVSVFPWVLGDHTLDSGVSPHRHYLVESSSCEELYLVIMALRRTTSERFEVFRLDRNDHLWIKVRSIGDDMIFVDYRNGVALSAREFRGCRGNCIYFVNYGAPITCPSLFDKGRGAIEEVPYCWEDSVKRWKYHGWIIPTI